MASLTHAWRQRRILEEKIDAMREQAIFTMAPTIKSLEASVCHVLDGLSMVGQAVERLEQRGDALQTAVERLERRSEALLAAVERLEVGNEWIQAGVSSSAENLGGCARATLESLSIVSPAVERLERRCEAIQEGAANSLHKLEEAAHATLSELSQVSPAVERLERRSDALQAASGNALRNLEECARITLEGLSLVSPAVERLERRSEVIRNASQNSLQLLEAMGLLLDGPTLESAILSAVERAMGPLHIVHTIGKVGSMTLRETISHLPLDGYVLPAHVHVLSEDGLRAMQRDYAKLTDANLKIEYAYPARVRSLLQLRRLLREKVPGLGTVFGRNYVITAIRDPIAASLSFLSAAAERFKMDVALDVIGIEENLQVTVAHFERWLHQELLPVHGIDVFSAPFPHAQGFQIYRGSDTDLLLIRLEDFARLPAALETFYRLPEGAVTVRTVNRTVDQPAAAIYRTLQEATKLPEEKLEAIYSSRVAQHFYTPEERKAFVQRWRR